MFSSLTPEFERFCLHLVENSKPSEANPSTTDTIETENTQTSNNSSDATETHLYKSTITAFDVLSERCSELIELFDESSHKLTSHFSQEHTTSKLDTIHQEAKEDTQSVDTSNTDTKSSSHEPNLRSHHLNSPFLERTLTFNSSITSSALLSSSNSSFTSPNNSTDKAPDSNSIKSLVFKMAQNETCLFGKSLSEFISCTSNSKEPNPNVLMSNMRQFMDGIKNYLLRNEINCELRSLIEKERANLDQTQILNIDSVLEDCLQSIILRPLKAKIYYLLVDWLITDSSIIMISKHMKKLNSLSENDCVKYLALSKRFGHKPADPVLKVIRMYYNKMQCEYAPLIKLKYMLFIINELLASIKDFESALRDLANLNVVTFLPVIIYTLCKCNMYAIQIELDYIWSLSNKKLLTNETIYYLTLMSSACCIIKNLEPGKMIEPQTTSGRESTNRFSVFYKNTKSIRTALATEKTNTSRAFSYMSSGLMEIYLTDEKFQTIKMKTIPFKPNSTCKEVNSLIAAKFKVFNSNDYALYCIEDGVEVMLKEDELPLEIKNEKAKTGSAGNPGLMFIYKQKNMNIVWPKCEVFS